MTVGTHDFDNGAGGYIERWSVSGESSLTASGRVISGVSPSGFQTLTGPMPLPLEHQQIQVSVTYEAAGEPSSEVRGIFDSRKLSAGHWLRGDGTQHDQPCD